MESQTECPFYDGVPTFGGPCWTCQNDDDHCPAMSPDPPEVVAKDS